VDYFNDIDVNPTAFMQPFALNLLVAVLDLYFLKKQMWNAPDDRSVHTCRGIVRNSATQRVERKRLAISLGASSGKVFRFYQINK